MVVAHNIEFDKNTHQTVLENDATEPLKLNGSRSRSSARRDEWLLCIERSRRSGAR